MQIEALKVLCDLAQFRSFSQAGAANGITQSAVSQLVSQLERRLAVQLVDRSIRPLRMTDAGRRFADGCQELLARYQALEASVSGASGDLQVTVQVAAIYSISLRGMNRYVEHFAATYPGSQVRIEYLHPDKVRERVMDGTAELGIVSFPRRTRALNAVPWRDEEMVLVCAPSHPLAGLSRVSPARLNGHDYIAFDRGLVIRREVDRFMREHDIEVHVVHEFDNIETIKRAVAEVAGVSILPLPTLHPEVDSGALVAIPLAGSRLVRPLGIIHRRPGPSQAAARFLNVLRELDLNGDAPHVAPSQAVTTG